MSHDRILIKGNEAVAFGALDAGCRCYFGYPITPQNEIPETMSLRLPECGGQFVQAESEVAAINMLLGAGACGIPAMTSSSSCGISLMQEGISYMAAISRPSSSIWNAAARAWAISAPRRATTSRPSRAAVTATTATWCWPPPPRRNATT